MSDSRPLQTKVSATWHSRGRVFVPDASIPWMRTHAALPTPVHLGDVLRVYFAGRDADNRSHVSYVDVDPHQPTHVIDQAGRPALAPGPLGHFDGQGVYPASVVRLNGRLRLYYIGWMRGDPPPMFYAAVGVAESTDGGETFDRLSRAPMLDRSEVDPWMVTSPTVIHEDDLWRMWYVSGLGWDTTTDGLQSRYHIKYAQSHDGLRWRREGDVAIKAKAGERNISRAAVLRGANGWEAWFGASDGSGYRLRHATSADGLQWTRDEWACWPSTGAWDANATTYPAIITLGDRDLMFYNGNGFGRTGFGVAVREA